MFIRRAVVKDAGDACSVLRRSIKELCFLDHGGDAEILRQWLGNKTPENVRAWIETPDRCVVVAEEDETILGVAAASAAGEIMLNYVAPEARFRGVSKAMLAMLEAYLRDLGLSQSTLRSSQTAHGFYLSAGYTDVLAPASEGRLPGQAMTKAL